MRHGSSGRRQRNRGGSSRKGSQNRNQVFDSNGPDVRIRGTAHQVAEKYEALAKDAASGGNVTMAQNYMQHAEHYIRIIASWGADDSSNNDKQKASKSSSSSSSKDSNNASNEQSESEDLGLPASILKEASVETQANKQSELEVS